MNTISIDELIYRLGYIKQSRGLKGDEPVVVGAEYGDRCGTIQAIGIDELETATLEDTHYSDSGYKIVEGEPEEGEEVVVLNYNDLFGW